MDRARHRRVYDLHSWTGLILGLFVFVVSFSGCLALFYHEVLTWEDPALRLEAPAEPIAFDDTFTAWIDERVGDGALRVLNLRFPSRLEPFHQAFIDVEADVESGGDGGHEHVRTVARWDPNTGALLPERGDGAARWLYDFHRDLMWPDALGGRTVGRALVGVAGVALLLSILTGVIAHTKIREELFSLRYLRSVRLRWQDTHKALGLWGLPFYTVIAFTGAFLGIVALLSPIVALLAFKGDQETLIESVIGAPPQARGVQAHMLSIDEVARMRHPDSGAPVKFVVFDNWGDEAAVFNLYFEPDTELAINESVSISGVTGAPVANPVASVDHAADRVTGAITPLHYATYGGLALKALYFALGLALCVITALGSMMWIERRLHGREGRRSPGFYRALSRLTVGVTGGIAVASVGVLYLDKLYFGPEAARLVTVGWTYFGVWAAAIAYAFLRRNDYGAARALIAAAGFGLLGLPAVNALVTGDAIWGVLVGDGHPVAAGVDLGFLIVGAGILATAAVLPKARSERAAAPAAAEAAPAA